MPGRVAIVGAGQVGTTLGMALREAGTAQEVALCDRDRGTAARSLAVGGGDRVTDLADALTADTVILALLVPDLPGFLRTHAGAFRPGTLVMDTGSTKRSVVAAMRELPPGVHAVGGHPLAGTEHAGPEGARPGILRDAAFALIPAREDPVAMDRAGALVREMGARAIEMDAETHDRVLARTSHVPHVLAAALALSAAGDRSAIAELASTGYHGVARLARSDPAMVGGFLADNADEVRTAVAEFRRALDRVAAALTGDPADIGRVLGVARAAMEGP